MRDQGFYLKKHGEGGELNRSEYYGQEGYQQGFMDAKSTGGKIKQENNDKFNLRKFGIILILLGTFIPSVLYPFTSLTPPALLAKGLELQKGVIYKTRIRDLEILIKEGKPKLDPKENPYYFAGEYDDRLAIPYKYPLTFGIVLFFIGITLNTTKRQASVIGNRVYFITVILLIIFSAAVGLYLIKTFLGIDLFHGVHIGRYFGI